jgi:hypothetical protein
MKRTYYTRSLIWLLYARTLAKCLRVWKREESLQLHCLSSLPCVLMRSVGALGDVLVGLDSL